MYYDVRLSCLEAGYDSTTMDGKEMKKNSLAENFGSRIFH